MRSVQLLFTLALLTTAALADPYGLGPGWVDVNAYDGLSRTCATTLTSTLSRTDCVGTSIVPDVWGYKDTYVHGVGTVLASYGALQVDVAFRGENGFSGVSPCCGYDIGGDSSFNDTLTVSGSGSGYVEYLVDYHPETGTFFPGALTLISGQHGQDFFMAGESQPFAFTAGVPFALSLDLFYRAVGASGDGLPYFGHADASIDQIQFFDANMNPITGYSLTSASRTLYPALGAAVPEPSAVWLLFSALPTFVLYLRGRKPPKDKLVRVG